MFDNLFIMVGGLFLSVYNSLINIKDIRLTPAADLNISQPKNEDKLKNLLSSKPTIIFFIVFALILLLMAGVEITAIYAVLIMMVYVFMRFQPQIIQQRQYNDLNQELPYALRHMGIELKSGKGLHDTLITVSNAGYGSFSRELTRVLEEIRYGQSTETSLLEMANRANSDGLSRCVQQIVGTLRVGGNLANSLEVIADDISFDMHVKLKDYSQRLNSFILIYTFVAILAPVILLIMLMAASTVMGDILSSSLVIIIYGALFPMIVVVMGLFIKKLEPKI